MESQPQQLVAQSVCLLGGNAVAQYGFPGADNRHAFVIDVDDIDDSMLTALRSQLSCHNVASCNARMQQQSQDEERCDSINSSLDGSTLLDEPQLHGASQTAEVPVQESRRRQSFEGHFLEQPQAEESPQHQDQPVKLHPEMFPVGKHDENGAGYDEEQAGNGQNTVANPANITAVEENPSTVPPAVGDTKEFRWSPLLEKIKRGFNRFGIKSKRL